MRKSSKRLKLVSYGILIPLLLIFGFFVLRDRRYNLISMGIVILICLPLFYSYEKKESTSRELVLLAVMVALAVVSRVAFFFVPSLNPMAAVIIISGIYLGSEFGFMIGALAPLISNMLFTQGPWTPFQMFSYGIVGLIGGLPFIAKRAKNSKLLLSLLGIAAGISYSLLMDIWSVLSIDRVFTLKRYLLIVGQALPFTVSYLVANVFFLNLLNKPLGSRLIRIKKKYGIDV